MRKLLSILFFIFVTQLSYGQTFTQTFVDRCTGEVQVVTANFVQGSAVVSFYNKVKIFTYQQYVNGEMHEWLMTTYAWWQALSPCSAAQTQATNAQNAANNATSNATNATNTTNTTNTNTNTGSTSTNNTSSTNTSSSNTNTDSGSSSSSGDTSNTNNTSNDTSSGNGSSDSGSTDTGGSTDSGSSDSSSGDSSSKDNSSDSSSGDSGSGDSSGDGDGSSNDSSGDSSEGGDKEGSSGDGDSSEGDNSESGDNESEGSGDSKEDSENKDNESNEESKEEESKSESEEKEDNDSEESEEEVKEEEKEEENSEEESEEESEESEEESEDEESEEEESEEEESEDEEDEEESEEENSEEDEEEEEEKEKKFLPIQLKADVMAQQALTLDYNMVLNLGASQSSIFGDRSYGANLMIYDNLKQANLSLNTSVVTMNDNYEVKWVDGANVSYMRNYKMNALSASASRMKPMGKWGTVGVGINYSYMFGKDQLGEKLPQSYMLGWNVLYTNMVKISDRIMYSPALVGVSSPLSYTDMRETDIMDFSAINKDLMVILANPFTVQLTNRFSFNVGWTVIYSTSDFIPMLHSFMIGSKIPF